MRVEEYNNYMKKRNLILEELKDENVDTMILEKLKENGLKVKNKNTKYMVDLVKKVLYDYELMGRERALEIINADDEHIHVNMESRQINRKKIQKLSTSSTKARLPYDNIFSNNFKKFILSIADVVYNELNEDKKVLTYTNI